MKIEREVKCHAQLFFAPKWAAISQIEARARFCTDIMMSCQRAQGHAYSRITALTGGPQPLPLVPRPSGTVFFSVHGQRGVMANATCAFCSPCLTGLNHHCMHPVRQARALRRKCHATSVDSAVPLLLLPDDRGGNIFAISRRHGLIPLVSAVGHSTAGLQPPCKNNVVTAEHGCFIAGQRGLATSPRNSSSQIPDHDQ